MFNNRPYGGNTNFQNVSVNTSFYRSYSDTAMLRLGAWNQQLSIELRPAIGTNASGVVQYAQESSQSIYTSIPQNTAIVLVEGFKKHILPSIENKEASPKVSITVANREQRKLISIYYDGVDSYLEIAVAVKEDGTVDETNVFRHKFGKKVYALDYDYTTGQGTEEVVESDFFDFMNKVEQTKDLTPFHYHAQRYSEAIRSMYANNNKQNNNPANYAQQPVSTAQNVSSDMSFLPFS